MKLFNALSVAALITITAIALRPEATAQSSASQEPAPTDQCESWTGTPTPTSASGTGVATGATREIAEQNAEIAAINALVAAADAEVAGSVNCPGPESCEEGTSGCEADAQFDQLANITSNAIAHQRPDGTWIAVGRASVTPGTELTPGCSACLAIIEPRPAEPAESAGNAVPAGN